MPTPSTVGHTKRSPCTFFDVWQRWIHWRCYCCHLKLFEIRPCLTFDLIRRSDEEVTVDFFWCLTKINTLTVLLLSFHVVCDLTFLTFDPLTIGQMKRSPWTFFDVWPRPIFWQCYFCHLRLFKIWPHFFDLSDLKWPQVKFIFIILKDNVKLLHMYEWHDNHK